MRPKAPMVAFALREPTDDALRSPEGLAPRSHYEGPHGPGYVAYNDEQTATRVWGPKVADGRLGASPFGRLDRRPLAFYQDPIPLHVGACSGQLVRPKWTTFSRRGRGIVVTLEPGSRRYLYRVTGFSRPLLERQSGGGEADDTATTLAAIDV